jgi:hypothetical protein
MDMRRSPQGLELGVTGTDGFAELPALRAFDQLEILATEMRELRVVSFDLLTRARISLV